MGDQDDPVLHFLHAIWKVLLFGLHSISSPVPPFWLYCVATILLVMIGGMMSGLNLGLLSLDEMEVEVLMRSGSPSEKRAAATIKPLLHDTHVLLVTLLLWNAVAMEALPLVLGVISTPFTAVLVSVTLVLVFGEIVPQAVCSRYGLVIGARVAWLVKALVVVSYPIVYPVGKLLDFALGPEKHALFRRVDLKALMAIHGQTEELGGSLTQREIDVVSGALDLTSKTASMGMTPLQNVFMLSIDEVVNDGKLQELLAVGHSRVPVFQNSNPLDLVGVLLVKEMVVLDLDKGVPVRSMRLRPLPCLPADTPMYDVLKVFQTGHSHMVLLTQPAHELRPAVLVPERQPGAVRKAQFHQKRGELEGSSPPKQEPILSSVLSSPFQDVAWDRPAAAGTPVGIITVEDVIEELMQDEILDETDRYADNRGTQSSKILQGQLVQRLLPSLKRLLSSKRSNGQHPPQEQR